MRPTHFTSVLAALFFCCAAASAAVLTPSEALSRAHRSPIRTLSRAEAPANAAIPVMTINAIDGVPALYVFDNDGNNISVKSYGETCSLRGPGYIIVSADDCAPAVLGYSDDGYVDPENMPPEMKYWLNEYARQIAYARQHAPNAVQAFETSDVTADFAPIEPMCKTYWSQGTPFNNMCPTVNGQRSVTGCVATAMAQIMKYHEYPAKGQGSHSYAWNDSTISLNFSDVTFDWDKMVNVYSSATNEAENNAIAQLMYACGVASNMNYSPNGSGASTFTAATGMIKYFNYDKGLRYADREYYSYDDWVTMIYNQLATNGPVQYSGQNDEGGHSFVCDGYSSDGYFHINWGWAGMSNGYFLLSALDPSSQGIGGTTSGYNAMQDVIFNAHAPEEGSTYYPLVIMPSGFSIPRSSVAVGNTFMAYSPVYSQAFGAISGTFALKCVSKDNPNAVYYGTGNSFSNLNSGYGYSQMQLSVPADIPDGRYTVSPVMTTDNGNTYYNCEIPLNMVRDYNMVVSNGTARFNQDEAATISLSNVTLDTPFYENTTFEVSLTATNSSDSEYYGAIMALLLDEDGESVAYGAQYPVDLEPGDSTDINYTSTFTSYNSQEPMTAGTFYLIFVDSTTNEELSEPQQINLQAEPASTVITATEPQTIARSAVIDITKPVTFVSTVKCTSGYFADDLKLAIFNSDGGSSIAAFSSPIEFIAEGEEQTVEFNADLSKECVPGKEYLAAVFHGQTQISTLMRFTADHPTGIDSITVDNSDSNTAIYTLQGVRINPANAAPGIYIKVSGGNSQKIVIK